MIDLYFFKIDVPTFILILSCIVFFVLQLLLCFKVKCVWLRLIPVFLSTLATIVFFILAVSIDGWDAVFCLLFALMSAILLGVCAFCWMIWLIVFLVRRQKKVE